MVLAACFGSVVELPTFRLWFCRRLRRFWISGQGKTINAECPEALRVPENLRREDRVLIEKVLALGHYPQDLNAKSRANSSDARTTEARLRKKMTRCRSRLVKRRAT